MSRTYTTRTEVQVDHETGEIMQSSKTFTTKTTAEKFMKVYLSFLSGELNLKDYEKAFIMELFPLVGYESNEFTLLLADKKMIADKLFKSLGRINNIITSLRKSKVLVVVSRGKYMLNPAYFFKGDEIQRGKIIEVYKQFVIE